MKDITEFRHDIDYLAGALADLDTDDLAQLQDFIYHLDLFSEGMHEYVEYQKPDKDDCTDPTWDDGYQHRLNNS